MNILDPKAFIGDRVWVMNYRKRSKKHPEIWELGTVFNVEYHLWQTEDGRGTWHYGVLLDRKGEYHRLPAAMRLYVSDDKIKII